MSFCCCFAVMAAWNAIAIADPSMAGNLKRARMQGKHLMMAKQPFKLLTIKRNSPMKVRYVSRLGQLLCDVSQVRLPP